MGFNNLKYFFLIKIILNLKKNCISSKLINQNININNCLISFIYSSGNGGAIYINSSIYSLNINDTTFYQCISTSGHGGAIYFENGFIIQLFRICALYCKSNSGNHYQFAYLQTNNNQLLDLISISKCYNNTVGYTTLFLIFGNQSLSNINISYNSNIAHSGISHVPSSILFSIYCTLYNNTVSFYNCIYLNSETGTISKSNIISNNSPSYGVIFVDSVGNYILTECIFDKNQNVLLYISGKLTLHNCFILSGSSIISGIVSNSIIYKITNYYQHTIYSTFYCSNNLNSKIYSQRSILKFFNIHLLYFFQFFINYF